MAKPRQKDVPKNIRELCERLKPYFNDLTAWLEKHHPEAMESKPGRPFEQDPPPRPPDLGV
jgi:hypothetical protein